LRIAGAAEKDVVKPVRDMLEWVGLAERMDARPATLSGGEQQRVAIARAVIGRPEILVADEPTGNVDPEMAVKLLRLFEALNRLGTTVLVATHDLHLLQKVPESLIMRLDRGRLTDPTGALRFPPRRPPRATQGQI
jgi:cell division transport system ATP-binding protein